MYFILKTVLNHFVPVLMIYLLIEICFYLVDLSVKDEESFRVQ